MDGMSGATSQRNRQLVRYGIAQDESDYRMHVSFSNWKVYLFPTEAGQKVLHNGKTYEPFRASQAGVKIVTGKGYKVPWQDIEGCQELPIPPDIIERVRSAKLKKGDTTSRKGQAAVWVATQMLRRGLVPLALTSKEITEHDMQVKGKDLIITSKTSIQVKCDWWASRYGRLAIQTHECNPLGRY